MAIYQSIHTGQQIDEGINQIGIISPIVSGLTSTYLKLDQTVPQTLIGSPVFSGLTATRVPYIDTNRQLKDTNVVYDSVKEQIQIGSMTTFPSGFGLVVEKNILTNGTVTVGGGGNIFAWNKLSFLRNDAYQIFNTSTDTNSALSLGTKNIEAIRIDPNRNVGIGITEPEAKLDINGGILVGNNYSVKSKGTGNLIIGNTSGGEFTIGGDGGNSIMGASYNNLVYEWSRPNDALTQNILFRGSNNTGVNEFMRISGTGNVGIGVIPISPLDIQTKENNSGINIRGFGDNSNKWVKINLEGNWGQIDTSDGFRFKRNGSMVSFIDNQTNNGFRMYDGIPLSFGTTLTSRYVLANDISSGELRIGYGGSVGIQNNVILNINQTGDLGIIGGLTTSGTTKLMVTPTSGTLTDGILVWNSTDKCVKQVTPNSITSGLTNLYFTNVTGSTWVADTTYAGYGYKCDLAASGVTASMYPIVTFGATESISGNYLPICESGTNIVTIYSKVNTSIVIPLIKVLK
jgi:hypothetical protein